MMKIQEKVSAQSTILFRHTRIYVKKIKSDTLTFFTNIHAILKIAYDNCTSKISGAV